MPKRILTPEQKAAASEWGKAYYLTNKEAAKARSRAWRTANKDRAKENQRSRYKAKKEKILAQAKAWAKANPEKRHKIEKSYRKKNRGTTNARSARYKAAKIRATPPWLTVEQIEQMAQFYRDCPKGYHVDHIWPLRCKEGAGLHVPWNLKIIPASENCSKSNKLILEEVLPEKFWPKK